MSKISYSIDSLNNRNCQQLTSPGNKHRQMLFIKDPYWLGIGTDALWAIGLLSPQAFDLLTDNRGFAPDWELRAVMDSGQVRDTLHIHDHQLFSCKQNCAHGKIRTA